MFRSPLNKNSIDEDSETQRLPLMEYPTQRVGAVTRIRNQIEDLWHDEDPCDVREIAALANIYYLKVKTFEEKCAEQSSRQEGITEIEKKKFEEWYEEKRNAMVEFENAIEVWLCNNQYDKEVFNQDGEVFTNDEIIKKGESAFSGTGSNTSSARLRLAERKAKLEAEAKIREEKINLEDQELKLARLREDLNLRQEKEELYLLEQNLNIIENSESASHLPLFQPERKENLNKTKKVSFTREVLDDDNLGHVAGVGFPDQRAISMALMKNHENSLLPKNEPEVFSGRDVTEFKSWLCAFENMIADFCSSNSKKFYYLEKYTSDEPKQLVKSCNAGDPSDAYSNAITILKETYGNEYLLTETYMKKLREWNPIKGEDGKAMREFSIFLRTCKNIIGESNSLNNSSCIRIILEKLPFEMKRALRSEFGRVIKSKGTPTFDVVLKFVSDRSFEMNMPVFGEIRDSRARTSLTDIKAKRSLATRDSGLGSGTVLKLKCECCSKDNHSLDTCFFFKKKPRQNKMELLARWKLCSSCFRTSDHDKESCSKKLTCKICKADHATCLHDEYRSESLSQTSNKTEKLAASSAPENSSIKRSCAQKCSSLSCNERIICSAVPVKIKINGKEDFVSTYIALDNHSTINFINRELLNVLNMPCTEAALTLKTMGQKTQSFSSNLLSSLLVYNLNGSSTYNIKELYIQETNWPFEMTDSPKQSDVEDSKLLSSLNIPFIKEKIGILIGANEIGLLKPLEIVEAENEEVYASRHCVGWAICGSKSSKTENLKPSRCSKITCYNEKLHEIERNIETLFASDFCSRDSEENAPSVEDRMWLKLINKSVEKQRNNYIQISLPFRSENIVMPYNYRQIEGRLKSLKQRFIRDPAYFEEYSGFISSMIQKGHLERVPESDLRTADGKVWYLSHFGVRHKQKQKLRVVFDASLKNAGVSLNDELLRGPDLVNSLLGILLRFREGKFAFSADIEAMFFQVKVPKEDSDFMRILWYHAGDLNNDPVPHRLTSHMFGAVSSPSCCSFALRHSTGVCSPPCSEEAKRAITEDFYVDDWLKSMNNEERAISLIREVKKVLAESNFNLTGFMSNSCEVLRSIKKESLSKTLIDIEIEKNQLPLDRALGVQWLVGEDCFGFKIKLSQETTTRRSILRNTASIFDPLGFVNPAIVPARTIFQRTCQRKLDWDEKLPGDLLQMWESWTLEILKLEEFKINRCLQPVKENYTSIEIHIFSDGSNTAYGAVAYARYVCDDGTGNSSLLMSKVKLVPADPKSLKTIPRIELAAARLSVILDQSLKRELTMNIKQTIFWVDSETVLRYLKNETASFKTYVANKVSYIRAHTDMSQWRFVPGDQNISDILSRGMQPSKFIKNKEWLMAPAFLQKPEKDWPMQLIDPGPLPANAEIKIEKKVMTTKEGINSIGKILRSSSNWMKILYRIATFLRLKQILQKKIPTNIKTSSFSLSEIMESEEVIWKYVQETEFSKDIEYLKSNRRVKLSSGLKRVNPFIDCRGILRVSGRLQNSDEECSVKNPIILHSRSTIVDVMARSVHVKSGHMGQQYLLSMLREKFWIIGGNAIVKRITYNCVGCRRRNGRMGQQIMAPLPIERVSSGQPAFTHVGVDFFGPFTVTRGRSRASEKRYGVVFSCLTIRAIHIEVAHSLTTDSFIDSFRRFVSRRGQPKTVHCDNGTNLVGGMREMRGALEGWNKTFLEDHLCQKMTEFRFHPPNASHFGGIYEREIRTIRKTLQALFSNRPHKLNDESLITLLCEVEAILNNKPLTPISSDPHDLAPLTPNHLLRMQKIQDLPPGIFEKEDTYGQGRWKVVQYLADEFWRRWRKEYLLQLQERQKWVVKQRPFEKDDLVLVVDQLLPRNQWLTGRIVEVFESSDGQIRKVRVKVSRCRNGKTLSVATSIMERPIHKLILLMPSV